MSMLQLGYTIAWMLFSCVTVFSVITRRAELSFTHSSYRSFLLRGWKLVTFAIALGAITAMGPFTGDPTWDFVTAPGMSVATFVTAPWVVGALYRVFRGRETFFVLRVACCFWMLSVSWLYDFYLLLRDGIYPVTWFANLAASSLLYFSGGLFWNLDWREGRGVTFAFLEEDWWGDPSVPVFRRIFWYILIFVALGASMLLPYLELNL